MTDSRGYIGTKVDEHANVHYTNSHIIHNYFPDPQITHAEYIWSGEGNFTPENLWQINMADERLSQSVGTNENGRNEIKLQLSGNAWNEGFIVRDNGQVFDSMHNLPAGRYSIAFKARADAQVTVWFQSQTRGDYWEEQVADLHTYTQQFIIQCASEALERPGLWLLVRQQDYADGASIPSTAIYISEMMITEGDAWAYRDGDSDGWEWLGTPHASGSYGTQP